MTAPPVPNSLSRRTVLKFAAAAAIAPGLGRRGLAAETASHHGLSVFGDLKYPAGFAHFDYVDPAAPKGGRLVRTAAEWAYNQGPLTFNTLNGFVLKGDAPPRVELVFDSLMTRASDEPDAVYGLLAESADVADDGTLYRFHLRPQARFHDGTPVTAADVAFSLNLLKEKGHPSIGQTIRDMRTVEAEDDRTALVRFAPGRARDLPLIVASLPVFPKAYWTSRDFEAATLEPLLGSGPYKIGRFEVGHFIEYDRVADYWGRGLPVNRGHHNFDVVRIEFYRDSDVSFEAFKKGGLTFREEFSSKTWSTGYDFPAVADGRIKRTSFPDDRPSGAQGFFLNVRRAKLADRKVREALIYAFDFEWSNATLFYGLYERTRSFFENSELMAEGLPSADELALLEPFRDQLPAEVFGAPFLPPVSDGTGQDRKLLRQADRLLREAGFEVADGVRRDATGAPFTLEFLSDSPLFERIVQPYGRNLKLLGIESTFRRVDSAQYQSRLKEFDFDITTRRYAMSATPGEGIRQYWGSAAANQPGSSNLSGIKDPVVDALIDRVIAAPSRKDLVTATRALDRVLRAGRYWVPQWYKASHAVAHWDVFGWPQTKPRYDFPVETTWWYDREKAARIGKAE
ncbi:MAG: ABC transporter substrate-binding protein [Hyphomicrobiales bacterium]|nr:ABC transporter substrate-binding protein [Hyphomicrobiales bacterium]